MAQTIESHQLSNSQMSEPASPGLWKLHLALGWTILFAALVGLFAVIWDIQWHTAVGRDRTLTAPHLFILGSATLMVLFFIARSQVMLPIERASSDWMPEARWVMVRPDLRLSAFK